MGKKVSQFFQLFKLFMVPHGLSYKSGLLVIPSENRKVKHHSRSIP